MELPKGISVFGFVYKLGGFSLNTPGHYTAVIYWHGKEFYYDGLDSTKNKGCKFWTETSHQQSRVLCILFSEPVDSSNSYLDYLLLLLLSVAILT